MNKKIVLQKYLSELGIDSRRKCEKLISEGKVKINGRIAKLGSRVLPGIDNVILDGKKLRYTQNQKVYIILNKPRGYVTTLKDEKGRKCVLDLIKNDIKERIYPVGRLDRDSEGLLIMTNDGDFANKLIHPSKNIWKVYKVTVKPKISDEQLYALSSEMKIDDIKLKPARVEILENTEDKSILRISIQEGRNRQIRKMCEQVGLDVARLKRIAIGNIRLAGLPLGKWKNLNSEEIKSFM